MGRHQGPVQVVQRQGSKKELVSGGVLEPRHSFFWDTVRSPDLMLSEHEGPVAGGVQFRCWLLTGWRYWYILRLDWASEAPFAVRGLSLFSIGHNS